MFPPSLMIRTVCPSRRRYLPTVTHRVPPLNNQGGPWDSRRKKRIDPDVTITGLRLLPATVQYGTMEPLGEPAPPKLASPQRIMPRPSMVPPLDVLSRKFPTNSCRWCFRSTRFHCLVRRSSVRISQRYIIKHHTVGTSRPLLPTSRKAGHPPSSERA